MENYLENVRVFLCVCLFVCGVRACLAMLVQVFWWVALCVWVCVCDCVWVFLWVLYLVVSLSISVSVSLSIHVFVCLCIWVFDSHWQSYCKNRIRCRVLRFVYLYLQHIEKCLLRNRTIREVFSHFLATGGVLEGSVTNLDPRSYMLIIGNLSTHP